MLKGTGLVAYPAVPLTIPVKTGCTCQVSISPFVQVCSLQKGVNTRSGKPIYRHKVSIDEQLASVALLLYRITKPNCPNNLVLLVEVIHHRVSFLFQQMEAVQSGQGIQEQQRIVIHPRDPVVRRESGPSVDAEVGVFCGNLDIFIDHHRGNDGHTPKETIISTEMMLTNFAPRENCTFTAGAAWFRVSIVPSLPLRRSVLEIPHKAGQRAYPPARVARGKGTIPFAKTEGNAIIDTGMIVSISCCHMK
jgi:hypothetical protein